MSKTNGASKSTKLRFDDDGMPIVPVGGSNPRQIRLREPTMEELATIHEHIAAADDAMTKIETLGPAPGADATRDEKVAYLNELEAYERQARSRVVQMFGVDSPYGTVFLEIVNMLGDSDEPVTTGDLYGWAMNARACNRVVAAFTAPLDGTEDDVNLQTLLAAARAETRG